MSLLIARTNFSDFSDDGIIAKIVHAIIRYCYRGSHIEKLQTRGQKVVGGLEANFHKRSLCVKFSHNTCTAL